MRASLWIAVYIVCRTEGVEKRVVFGNVSQQLLFVFSNFRLYKYFFLDYRKIPKISPGAYIFQRPFLRGLFLEGLIYGGKFAF